MQCSVEVDVYVVQLVHRESKKVLQEFDAGINEELANITKDEWDLTHNTGSTFTRIEIYGEEIDE